MSIAKAKLTNRDNLTLEVQFNPETLSLRYETVGEPGRQRPSDDSQGGDPKTAGQASNRTGYTVTLSQLNLLFDTSDTGEDVRNKTVVIAGLMAPIKSQSPIVYFEWGTLIFKGHITGFTESLAYFSDQGVPLRATVNLEMTATEEERASNEITGANSGLGLSASASLGASIGASAGVSAGVSAGASFGASAGASVGASVSAGLNAGASIGTTPLTFSQGGESLQSLSAQAGLDWRAVAELNNIDNPRALQAGTVLNLNVGS